MKDEGENITVNDEDVVAKAIDLLSEKTCNTCEFCAHLFYDRFACIRHNLSDPGVQNLQVSTTCCFWAKRSETLEKAFQEIDKYSTDLSSTLVYLDIKKNLIKSETGLS